MGRFLEGETDTLYLAHWQCSLKQSGYTYLVPVLSGRRRQQFILALYSNVRPCQWLTIETFRGFRKVGSLQPKYRVVFTNGVAWIKAEKQRSIVVNESILETKASAVVRVVGGRFNSTLKPSLYGPSPHSQIRLPIVRMTTMNSIIPFTAKHMLPKEYSRGT
jgi:hypothetical protein